MSKEPKNRVGTWELSDITGKPVIDCWYPRSDESHKPLEVGLVDVRASDGILIDYDFDRDGWVIKQASVFAWGDAEDGFPEWDPKSDNNEDWQEVAFIKSWAREVVPPGLSE